MSQYFTNDDSLLNEEFEITYHINGHEFLLKSNNGVFSKKGIDYGSNLLINTLLPLNLEGYILDLGCGIGIVGLSLAYFDKNEYCLVDINQTATSLAKKNAQSLNLSDRIEVTDSDGFTKINEKIFDYILFNPPIRAGKETIYKLYRDGYDHLNSGGLLFIVIRKDKGALSHEKFLKNIFQKVETEGSK